MATEVLSSDLYVGVSLETWNAVFDKPPIYIFLLLQNFLQSIQLNGLNYRLHSNFVSQINLVVGVQSALKISACLKLFEWPLFKI